jgi:hypothetical protein
MEDQPIRFSDWVDIIPDVLLQAIIAITKSSHESRGDYLDRCMENPYAHKVKIADTLCNLTESVKSGDVRRIKKYTKQLEILHSV